MAKDVYDIGEIPPVGEVPRRMHAQLSGPTGTASRRTRSATR